MASMNCITHGAVPCRPRAILHIVFEKNRNPFPVFKRGRRERKPQPTPPNGLRIWIQHFVRARGTDLKRRAVAWNLIVRSSAPRSPGGFLAARSCVPR